MLRDSNRMDMMDRMKHEELTAKILECCFEVINELRAGFLESVYERALIVAITQRGLSVSALKAVTRILSEHKAQVINYLNATGIGVGLLVNFGSPEGFRPRPSNPVHPV